MRRDDATSSSLSSLPFSPSILMKVCLVVVRKLAQCLMSVRDERDTQDCSRAEELTMSS